MCWRPKKITRPRNPHQNVQSKQQGQMIPLVWKCGYVVSSRLNKNFLYNILYLTAKSVTVNQKLSLKCRQKFLMFIILYNNRISANQINLEKRASKSSQIFMS